MLEIWETANYDLKDIDYDICIFDSPSQVYDLIKEKNKERNQSCMLAGYSWDWKKQYRNDSSYHDIQIGDFGMS